MSTAQQQQVPDDDHGLEMEELEGLVNVNNKPSSAAAPKRSSSPILSPTLSAALAGAYHGKNRNRIMVLVGLVAVLAMIVIFHVAGDAVVADGDVIEVEGKDEQAAAAAEGGGGEGGGTTDDAEPKKEDEKEDEKEGKDEPTTPPPPMDWGHWKFYDGDEENRPKEDYCGKYPHRDIKGEDFPDNAWQTDAVYVNHFLNEADKLITRAKEAIYTEYGHGKPLPADEMFKRAQMFKVSHVDLAGGENPPKESADQGGWTTKRSFTGLTRRLLHAMMTNDSFTVVLGGHSAAAGHGNHFNQSYAMQFHHIMEPVFERLGVKLITRNMAQGGLGTMQSALGSGSIYGDEIDLIIWDSHMTEGRDDELDLFFRQALVGGNRVPFLLGVGASFNVLKMLHENAGADVGLLGSGRAVVPMTEDEVQVRSLPWAAQYVKCDDQRQDLCNDPANKFRTKCWVDRPDVTPPTKQAAHHPGQASWHPGFRGHRLTSRVLAFWVLDALQLAAQQFTEVTIVEGDPLPDEYWHMADYYEKIREKLLTMEDSYCEKKDWPLTKRLCRVAMKGRTEYTPRADPEHTSIRSIIKPAPDGYVPSVNEEKVYDGPDVPNPALQLPDDAVDVREIVGARRLNSVQPRAFGSHAGDDSDLQSVHDDSDRGGVRGGSRFLEKIVPGRGWGIQGEPPGFCDGSASSVCGRMKSSDCLLSGHNDGRGGLVGDALSGWLVMELKGVKEGIIIISHDWYHPEVEVTRGWTEENDGKRRLKGPPVPPKEGTIFEYAIDGQITSMDHNEVWERKVLGERVCILLPLLDDEEMAKEGKAKDIELAIRLTGCKGKERECRVAINHVYWA